MRKEQVRIDLAQEKLLLDALKSGEMQSVRNCMDHTLDRCISGGYPPPGELIAEISRLLNHVAMQLVYPLEFTSTSAGMNYLSYEEFRKEIYAYLEGLTLEMSSRNEGKVQAFVRNF